MAPNGQTLAQLVEKAHSTHKHKKESTNDEEKTPKANGSALPVEGNVTDGGLRPKRSISASVPSSPQTPSNSKLRSPSLSGPQTSQQQSQRHSRGDTEVLDPQGAQFVRTDSNFRSAWSYRDPDGDRRQSQKRRGSWTGSRSPTIDEGGIWRRWVEIPLGLAVPDPNEGQEQVDSPQSERGEGELGPRTSSPEPQQEEAAEEAPAQKKSKQQEASASNGPSRQGSTSLWPQLPDLSSSSV